MTHVWRPTAALLRAALVPMTLAVVAVLAGRPDLLVLGAPMLVLAAAAVLHRPAGAPRAETSLLHATLREGEGTTVRATVSDAAGIEHVTLGLTPRRFLAFRPPRGIAGVTVPVDSPRAVLDLPVGTLRWGRRSVGDGLVAATSGWAGYRWGPVEVQPQMLTTLPMPGRFDVAAAAPHPIGLVGQDPARRTGDGTDFASIRPF